MSTKPVSLRQAARDLGYAVSTLYQFREEGVFSELPGGGYSLQVVAKGLLDSTSPRTSERREHLERVAAGQRPQTQLSPQIEAAIKASSSVLREPDVLDAMVLLANTPERMAAVFHSVAPIEDPKGARRYFAEDLVGDLRALIAYALDEDRESEATSTAERSEQQPDWSRP